MTFSFVLLTVFEKTLTNPLLLLGVLFSSDIIVLCLEIFIKFSCLYNYWKISKLI